MSFREKITIFLQKFPEKKIYPVKESLKKRLKEESDLKKMTGKIYDLFDFFSKKKYFNSKFRAKMTIFWPKMLDKQLYL